MALSAEEKRRRVEEKRHRLDTELPAGAPLEEDEVLDEDGDIPDDDEELLTPDSFEDNMGNTFEDGEQFSVA